jgi:hypothetical protein
VYQILGEGKMQYQVIDWNSPGNYDLFWVIIGAILFGLLFADFIWIYYKINKKDSESAPQKKTAYNQRKILEHT